MATINGYTLIEPPYQGGMALVYKGVSGPFARAFKMVRPDKAANNPKLCSLFLKEIKMQTSFDHPNIVKILGAYPFFNNGNTVTVLEMEWLNGMDLQRFIDKRQQNGMDAATVTKIALHVIDGLEYAHKKNILHLDIKPSNIFRTKDGFIKIIDFGIARVIGENAAIVDGADKLTLTTETGESTFKGTMAYASPEQQVGAKLGFTSDIYSFGKTLHFLCTGSTDPAVDVSDPLLSEIINKCTILNPKFRYQTFGEVRQAFLKPSSKMRCSSCGHYIETNVKYCPNCGRENKTFPIHLICPKCGKERKVYEQYCSTCGFVFYKKETDSQKMSGYSSAKQEKPSTTLDSHKTNPMKSSATLDSHKTNPMKSSTTLDSHKTNPMKPSTTLDSHKTNPIKSSTKSPSPNSVSESKDGDTFLKVLLTIGAIALFIVVSIASGGIGTISGVVLVPALRMIWNNNSY